ncbi:MAG: hypothetical protein QOH91_2298, partial [Mycobacterium sp.]|nr:hypothetical protein [Mycobacterium sp.]
TASETDFRDPASWEDGLSYHVLAVSRMCCFETEASGGQRKAWPRVVTNVGQTSTAIFAITWC